MSLTGIDGSGRNIYSNGAATLAWNISVNRWEITYDGNIFWVSFISSSPDPSFNISDWSKGVTTCNILTGLNKFELEICNSGADEDLDGAIDCLDSDCAITSYFLESSSSAGFVTGQDDFISNDDGLSPDKLNGPSDIAIDPISNKIFVADTDNHRILRYSNLISFLNNSPAESVLGQTDFVSNVQINGPNRTQRPRGVFVDQDGALWVACYNGSRVLRFDDAANKAIGANADGVLGQPNFTSASNGGGAARMYNPTDIYVDENNTLWVSDFSNNRVLKFDNASSKANGAPADGVLGKPDFITYSGPLNVSTIGSCWGIVKIGNSLFVSDFNGHRIMRWDNPETKANGADADMVIGQPNFNHALSGLNSCQFNRPNGLDKDNEGRLYVCDNQNSRILVYEDPTEVNFLHPADKVLGQADFTSNAVGTQSHELNRPKSVAVFDDGVSSVVATVDCSNHRILSWGYSNTTDELSNYSSSFFAHDPQGKSLTYGLGSPPIVGSITIDDITNGDFTFAAPGPSPLMVDTTVGLNYTITNGICSLNSSLNLRVTDSIQGFNSTFFTSCTEDLEVNWFDGSDGIQWQISNGASTVSDNFVVNGISGAVEIDMTLDNSSGHNIDFGNCGTVGNHFYTATCNDPNATSDCDNDPLTTDGQMSMGCGNLTMGMTSVSSDDEVKLTMVFDFPVRVSNLKIIGIDYDGSPIPSAESWQDEIEIRAFDGVIPVGIYAEVGEFVAVSNNPSPVVNIYAIYDENSSGNLSSGDPRGHAEITSMDYVTSLEIIMSNGPDDDGISDDHVIGISSFNICPRFDENVLSLCNDGLDNDMDGFIDCLDNNCNGIASCDDSDMDGINDLIDMDDDNDGISDLVESNRKIIDESFTWSHDNPKGGFSADLFSDNGIYEWATTSISPESSSNLVLNSNFGNATISGIIHNSLVEAIAGDQYIQYEFSMSDDAIQSQINWISAGLSSFLEGDSFYASCLISEDNFSNYTVLAADVLIKVDPSSYASFTLTENIFYPLDKNKNYTIRIYPYNPIDDSPMTFSPWDDFTINLKCFEAFDSDMDSIENHLDIDSDNDGIFDVIEVNGPDPDFDGIIGTGSITDPNYNGWSVISDPSESGTVLIDLDSDGDELPDRIEIDSDDDGCNDVIEAGFPDSNGDGRLGGMPISINSKGSVIYTP